MPRWRETRDRDGRSWTIGRDSDLAWINDGTAEPPGNGIGILIPPVYDAYWTLDAPGTAEHDQDPGLADRLERATIELLVAHTPVRDWWIGFLERGAGSELVFPDAPRVTLINGGVVLIDAGPEQALDWRDEGGWPHGGLPDVMFPHDRVWLSVTGWDDYWMCLGGTIEMRQAFIRHPLLKGYTHPVGPDDDDATPPGHDVWWHRSS